jgi:sRNA-binding carbon storage regulator CsrA
MLSNDLSITVEGQKEKKEIDALKVVAVHREEVFERNNASQSETLDSLASQDSSETG